MKQHRASSCAWLSIIGTSKYLLKWDLLKWDLLKWDLLKWDLLGGS